MYFLSCVLLDVISDQTITVLLIEATCAAATSMTIRTLVQPAYCAVPSGHLKRADGRQPVWLTGLISGL